MIEAVPKMPPWKRVSCLSTGTKRQSVLSVACSGKVVTRALGHRGNSD